MTSGLQKGATAQMLWCTVTGISQLISVKLHLNFQDLLNYLTAESDFLLIYNFKVWFPQYK
jgi:hypothetical protein